MTLKTSSADRLRNALEEARSGYERARLGRLRAPAEALDLSPLGAAHAFLASEYARDALLEAADSASLAQDERQWLERQMAWVRCMVPDLRLSARLWQALRGLRLPSEEAFTFPDSYVSLMRIDDARARAGAAHALEQALRPIAAAYARQRVESLRPLQVSIGAASAKPAPAPKSSSLILSPFSPEAMAPPPSVLPPAEFQELGEEFLERTDAAAEDAVRYALRGFKVGKPIPLHLLMRGLRAPDLDSNTGAKRRFARVAAWLHGLGFGRELQTRMRAEPDHTTALPFATVLPLAIPLDVRVAQSPIDFGVASDVFAAEGVARALGLALGQVALQPELRWPLGASVSGVLGGLGSQLWGDPEHLQRVQRIPAAAAERVGRLARTLALLWARLWVALACAPPFEVERGDDASAALSQAASRALFCDVPPSIASLLGADALGCRARGLELLTALALRPVLRERFDRDWFRNPRTGEWFRAICERGNARSLDALCAELGTQLGAAGAAANALIG